MNIGVFFKHKPSGGGIFQYFLTVLKAIQMMPGDDQFFLFMCHGFDSEFLPYTERFQVIRLDGDQEPTALEGYPVQFDDQTVVFRTRPYSGELATAARANHIDLMVYPNIERESFEANVPFVSAFHDWTHKTHPQFEEFVANGVYEQREYINQYGTAGALSILADSETAKAEIVEFYQVQPKKIDVLPFVAPPTIRSEISAAEKEKTRARFQLPQRYLFYPAQFWPHKNHQNIIRALHILKNEFDLHIPLVLVGSTENQWANLAPLNKLATQLGVFEQIQYLGYVPDECMSPLYAMANALVMPTFPGPTNIPVLEALTCGCPVITTDIQALHEQLGNAAIFIDPYDPQAIADAINRIWNDSSVSHELRQKGYRRIEDWNITHFSNRLEEIIRKAKDELVLAS